MARIRTIKPEFPQSESMGRVSREARLTFLLLWTIADDEGRLRGNSRMLASLLFPYDDGEDGNVRTSGNDVERWLVELEGEGCIIRYQDEGSSYVQVANWLIHQKIDKPSKSKIPPPPDNSRNLANVLEASATDLGPRTTDLGREGTTTGASAPGGGGDVPSGPDDIDPPKAGRMPPPEYLPAPTSPAVAIAVALRPLGVSATAMHPTVIEWADRGVSLEILIEAIREARETKGNETLSPNYLAPIVNRLLNPVERRSAPRQAGPVNEKYHFAHLDRSGDRAAMEASMARHGITVPGADEEIEI